jgi:nucleoside-diphosphate-sugar epimerase
MSRIVAVAGGTGKLGRAIVECLVSSGNFQVLVFAREVCICILLPQPSTYPRIAGQRDQIEGTRRERGRY